jgi:hypothetical protein
MNRNQRNFLIYVFVFAFLAFAICAFSYTYSRHSDVFDGVAKQIKDNQIQKQRVLDEIDQITPSKR